MERTIKEFIRHGLRGLSRYLRFTINYKNLVSKYGKANVIVAEGFIKSKGVDIEHYNWGDDLNKYFFELATGKKVLICKFSSFFPKAKAECYLLVGSILNNYSLEDKYIYGSGIIDPQEKVEGKPRKIYSVRGPKTQKVLEDHGIPCPDKYGDPALLLPLFYQPKLKDGRKKEKVCLIPHKYTKDKSIKMIQETLAAEFDLEIIDMGHYKCWTDIIDKIADAKFVISESLHGLIVAETYGVPNAWVEICKHERYWKFKFEDYYTSIGKNETMLEATEENFIALLKEKVNSWKKADIDYDVLLSYFPFEISPQALAFKGTDKQAIKIIN